MSGRCVPPLPHYITTVSPVYHHCISITVDISMELYELDQLMVLKAALVYLDQSSRGFREDR